MGYDLGLIPLGSKYNLAAPGANTDIFATALAPKRGASVMRVTVLLATGSVFKARVSDGTTTFDAKLNGGTALVASVVAVLSFAVRVGFTYNFRVETDGVIQMLLVDEVTGGVL